MQKLYKQGSERKQYSFNVWKIIKCIGNFQNTSTPTSTHAERGIRQYPEIILYAFEIANGNVKLNAVTFDFVIFLKKISSIFIKSPGKDWLKFGPRNVKNFLAFTLLM